MGLWSREGTDDFFFLYFPSSEMLFHCLNNRGVHPYTELLTVLISERIRRSYQTLSSLKWRVGKF